jgi:hypothetical protein
MEKSYLELCKSKDVISLVKPLLQQANYKLRDADGKIYAESYLSWDTPWHHVYHAGHLDCQTWNRIIFNFVFTAAEEKWAPLNCHNCFKVVIRPPTLKALFALLDLEKRMGRPSKCGIEIRDTVFGLYGGYFYNWGLDAGLECYEAVRAEIDADPELGKEVPVILKRACTEFELLVGPSDKWQVNDKQVELESLVNRWFVRDIKHRNQPDHAIANVHRRWIEFAYMCGDETYLEYTNGEPLYPPAVTYHHLVKKPKKKIPKQAKGKK